MLFGMGFLVACGAPAITAIEIDIGNLQYLEVGQETTLTAILTPKNASQGDVLWSSSDKSVATITSSGKVTTLKSGTTQITAMSKKNSNVKATVSLQVFGQGESVILLNHACTYDGTAKSHKAISSPEGIEIRYTYSSETYEESEYAPINAGIYTVKAYNSVTGTVLAQATLTINPKQAYLNIKSYTKNYSENDPAFEANVEGLIGSDRITYTLSRNRGESVGNYPITANITDSTNYKVTTSNGTLEIKPLEVKIEVDNKTSIYGNNLAALTFTLKTKDNFILNDTIKSQVNGSLKLVTPAETQGRLPVGNYTISCEDLRSTNLSIISTNNGIYSVTKRTATVSVSAGQYKYSGEKDPALVYSINGTQEGDDLTGCLSRVEGEIVGFYSYKLDQAINPNYNLKFNEGITNFSFEIKSNEITIAFNDFEVDYSAENAEGVIPAGHYNYTITKNGKPLDYTLDTSGKVYLNSTDAVVLNHVVTKELTLNDAEKKSFYQKWKVALEKSAVAGYEDSAKYTFTFVDGYKFIKLIPLTVTGNYATKVYGEVDPEFSYTASGYLEGDNNDNVIKSIELKRENGENVASYNITLKSDIELFDTKSYYKITFENGTFEITKRELRVTPVNYTGDNSVYYGESPKELKIDERNLNLAPRDILSKVLGGTLSRANNENVGSYAILGTNLELLSNNYTLTFTQGTYTIIPRPIAVTAINKTVEYGETVSKYQYSYQVIDEFTLTDEDGEEYTVYKEYVLDNPTFTGSLSLTTYGILYAGNTYTIGQGNLTCGSNYTITFNKGTLTVVPREITITFNAQSYGFDDYNEQKPTPKFSVSPSLAYSDKCALTYYTATSSADSNIISLQKDAEGNFVATFEMTTSGGSIINDCYNIHIDENYTELFYLGTSLIDVAITNIDGDLAVNKVYGDNYKLTDVFKLTTTKEGYTLDYTENVFNIKGLTNAETFLTPASVDIDAGTYTVAIFTQNLKIKDASGVDVSSNFAINISSYASLVVEKATLTAVTEPTINRIVYGTEKPTFNGGTYTFAKANGEVVTISGVNSEYSTADTSSYGVTTAENPHLIMATFTPSNTNFKSYTHSNLKLAVARAILDTSVLVWDYGTSMENKGEYEGNTSTIKADLEGVTHITYNQESTSQNTYNIPTKLPNYRFLKQTLSFEYLYYGVMFKEIVDEDGNVTDGGFMYYIDGGVVKKVYPANKTSFFAKYNPETENLEIYYNDGEKDYLLTNSETLAENGKPTYNTSIYSPNTSGIYFVRARISSLDNNYAVAGDGLGENNTAKIDYHNLFIVKKVTVKVYSFTQEIVYNNPLNFIYITDPQNITGKVTKYFAKDADGNYTELSEDPKNVGSYSCTFIIDRANYYYYKEHSDFNIVPVTIKVEWGNEESFSFEKSTPKTRKFKVFANDTLVYDTDAGMQIPEWLSIEYSGIMKNNQPYPTDGTSTPIVPSNAGDYTINISTISNGTDHNYVGSDSNTYSIAPIFYNGIISIRSASITYDVEYSRGKEGAVTFYNLIVEKMISNWTPADEEFNVILSYNGIILDPTGTDTQFVTLLNRAGGPYKITAAISSKDGNYKESIRTASLNVNKTNIPNMANYATEAISIPYNGDNVYNELTTADGSKAFTPTHIDKTKKTYEYWHNEDKDTYFGITYTYYLVTSSSTTVGTLTEVPNAPDETLAYIYMVKAVITNGANYNEPIQNTYYGYYYVVKTTIEMRAENIVVGYTGEDIELPTVKAVNSSNAEIAVRYDNKAGSVGVPVNRKVTKNGSTVTKINGVGEYLVEFTIAEADRTNFYENGSIFSTSCTVTVTPKKIIADSSFIIKPEVFYTQLFAQNSNTFKLDTNKAKAFNPDYVNNSSIQIELYITDRTDGSGNIYQRKDWKNLPAGIYYYYIGLISNPANNAKIKNYTQSDFVEFEIVRQTYTIRLTEEAQNGITINYAPSTSQTYSYTNLIVEKNGVSQSGFTQNDFEIFYKPQASGDEAYTNIAPITNGTYTVKVRLFNNFYQSEYLLTKLTISAPTLSISGNINLVYGQAETTLSINLSATGTNYTDNLTSTFDETTGRYKYNQETGNGYWFVLGSDMLCTEGDDRPRKPIMVKMEDADEPIDIQPLLFSYIEQNDITIKFLSDLNAMSAGVNYLPIFYFSKNGNFALSYSEFIVTVSQYSIEADMIQLTKLATDKPDAPKKSEYNAETGIYSLEYSVNKTANSKYDTEWKYENISISDEKTYFTFRITFKDKENSPVEYLSATATISTILDSATISAYFNNPTENVIKISTNLVMDDSNYTISNKVVYTETFVPVKTTTTVFSEKTNLDGSYQEIEMPYGNIFLDEYWGNRIEDLPGTDGHLYLYNLIESNFRMEGNAEEFRKIWGKKDDNEYTLYTLDAYTYTKNNDGTYTIGTNKLHDNTKYRADGDKAVVGWVGTTYQYDLSKASNAGLYYIVITLTNSDFFTETILHAVVRIKPTTYYLKTSSDGFNQMIKRGSTEDIALYDVNGSVQSLGFTANYYEQTTTNNGTTTGRLMYSSKVSWSGSKKTITPVAGGVYSTYADFLNGVGTGKFVISVVPDSVNSVYADDLVVLVVGESIDLGTYNIYDILDLQELQGEGQPLEILGKMGTLSWGSVLDGIFDKTGKTLTEDALSIMRFMDDAYKIYNTTPTNVNGTSRYVYDLQPDENHQLVYKQMMLTITLDNNNTTFVMLSLKVNLKLVTKIDESAYIYDGNAHAPNITAHFQGWTYMIKADQDPVTKVYSPNVNDVLIKELTNSSTIYTPTEAPEVVYYKTTSEGFGSREKPTEAGSYRVVSKYKVVFGTGAEQTTETFECTNNFTILKAKADITMRESVVLYDGRAHEIEATSIEGLDVDVKYYDKDGTEVYQPKDAGVYRAVASIRESSNYYGTVETTLTIKKASTRIELTLPDNLIYTGNNIKPIYKVYNENNVEIPLETGTYKEYYNGIESVSSKAGSYTYKLVILENVNTLPNEASISYVIEKATPEITFTEPANNVYNGQAIIPTIKVVPSIISNDRCFVVTYNGSTTAPSAAGVYRVNVSYTPDANSNYNAVEASYTYEILPQSIRVSYDGSSTDKIITITYSPSMSALSIRPSTTQTDANVKYLYEGYSYNDDGSLSTTKYSSETFPTDAGIYTITATPGSSNYTGVLVTTLVINRATPSITFSGVLFTYNGEAQTPTASTNPTTLAYETNYTGVDFTGASYNSSSAPTNAGIYTMTTSFAGNKNYMDVKNSQAFNINKISTAKIEFIQDSLTTTYNGSELKPSVKVTVNDVENTSLADDVILTFSETGHTPINAGSYKVVASLNTCNYTATEVTATFIINKSGDYTITLDNNGKLTLSATRYGSTNIISETIEVEYVGKIYLSDGSLPEENNFTSFSFPAGIAGIYTGTIIANNYEAKTFDFEIEKTDLSSRISTPNISIVLGQKPELPESLTIDGENYNVAYTFMLQTGTDYTSTMPSTIGKHSMKVVIQDKNYKGEKIVDFTVTYPNEDTTKVVLDSKYYMYTGDEIIIGAKLYLNGLLQTNASKRYKKDGSYINSIIDEGEYEVELYVDGNSGSERSATVIVVPAITLSVPSGAIYDKTEKEVSYAFVASENEALHGSYISLILTKNGYVVDKAVNAGSYIATICYDGYAILTKTFTIQKQTIDSDTLGASLPDGGINVTYGSYNSIPTILNTHTVKYLISIGGTTSYKEIAPPVGNHKIKFVIDEENYQGETTTDLHVSKKLVVINIEDFETEYTGKQLVLPETLANFDFLTYKYNTTPSNYIDGLPTDVGTYYISANSSSQNYAVSFKNSSRPYIIVTIKKATPKYIITNLEQVYDGSVKVPAAQAVFNGKSYSTHVSNSNMIDAGTYSITFSISDNANFNDSEEFTFIIKKADITISYTLPNNLVYDGTQKSITATASVEAVGAVSQTITKDGTVVTPVDAGTYLATLTTEETENYNACTVNIVFAILPADITIECLVADTSYSGTPKVVEATCAQPHTHTVTYEGLDSAPTEAGDYVAIVTVVPTDKNYATKTIRYKFSITKILDPITFTAPEDKCFDYDGTAKGITNVSSGSGTHTVTYEVYKDGQYIATTADKIVDEGSYKAVVTTTGDKNYIANIKTICFNIKKRLIVASITSNVVTYNAMPQSVILEDNSGLGSKIVVKYYGHSYNANGVCDVLYGSKEAPLDQSPTNPGIYTALLISTDDKYAIAGSATATLIINRLSTNINIKISKTADGTVTDIPDETIVVDYTGDVYTVSATASNGYTLKANEITTTLSGYVDEVALQEGGNYEIVADVNNDKYFGYAKRLFTIRPQEATIFAKQTAIGYTGAENDLVYIVVDKNGEDITDRVKDNIRTEYFSNGTKMDHKPIVIGEYTAHLTLANSSYAADATYTFSIVKSTPYVEYVAGASIETLGIESSVILSSFKITQDSYRFVINGNRISSTQYTATFLKSSYDENDEIVWSPATDITDNTITKNGAYKLRITITDPNMIAEYKECLENFTLSEDGNSLYYDFLFTIIANNS